MRNATITSVEPFIAVEPCVCGGQRRGVVVTTDDGDERRGFRCRRCLAFDFPDDWHVVEADDNPSQ